MKNQSNNQFGIGCKAYINREKNRILRKLNFLNFFNQFLINSVLKNLN